MKEVMRRLLHGGRREYIHDPRPYDPRRLARH